MPLSATLETIKAYQQQLEKNEIKPDNLPPCPRCLVKSAFFKEHAYRDRKFLVIIDSWVKTVLSALLRFKCPGCGKTFTNYPDFALPHKHYTRQITHLSRSYVQNPEATYQKAIMVNNSAPGYPDDQQTLAPSTIHRFITTLSGLKNCSRKALDLILQEKPASAICRNIATLKVPGQKFKSKSRENILVQCSRFFEIETLFQHTFNTSIFTKLAIRCAFT
jgi:transposase-like protein